MEMEEVKEKTLALPLVLRSMSTCNVYISYLNGNIFTTVLLLNFHSQFGPMNHVRKVFASSSFLASA